MTGIEADNWRIFEMVNGGDEAWLLEEDKINNGGGDEDWQFFATELPSNYTNFISTYL